MVHFMSQLRLIAANVVIALILVGCASLRDVSKQSAAGMCLANAESYAFTEVGETKGHEVQTKGKMPRFMDSLYVMIAACAMTGVAVERVVAIGEPAKYEEFRRLQYEVITKTVQWQIGRFGVYKDLLSNDMLHYTAAFLPQSLDDARRELPEWRKVIAYLKSNPGTRNASADVMREAERVAATLN